MIQILDKIRRAGGTITVLDGRVRIEASPGTLSDQDRQVLAQHKQDLLRLFTPADAVVVDPYLDQERRAIQWVESLSPAEADQVLDQAVRDWDRITGGDHGRQQDEPEIVDQADEDPDADPDQWLTENTVEPIECGKCGSLDRWQDLAGNWHCLKCDPPIRAQIIRERAARLRRQHGDRYCTQPGGADNRNGAGPVGTRSRPLTTTQPT